MYGFLLSWGSLSRLHGRNNIAHALDYIANLQYKYCMKEKLEFLVAAGLSDYDIAEKVGVSPSTIWRLRTGKTGKTDWNTGESITRLYRQHKKDAAA